MTQKHDKSNPTGCGPVPKPSPLDNSVGPNPHRSRTAPPGTTRVFNSADLLGEHAMVFIQHQGEMYRLQSTRQGKLILTK
jgi:hemin uptake protein HemP